MQHSAARPHVVLASLVLAAGLAGCAVDATSPRDGVVLEARAGGTSVRVSNTQRYRSSGSGPVSARSGSAVVGAEALLMPSGQTALLVTSARATAPAIPAGSITKLQAKAFDVTGRLLFALNLNQVTGNPARVSLPAMPAGVTIQVTAHVTGIDGRRTDVVTVSGIVPAAAPDLAVLAVGVPASAIAGSPVIVSATVGELGGDRGASGDCVLYVDGLAVDRAAGIWVDAGDAVSCAFTPTFTAGTHDLRVAIEGVQPLDAEASNNSAGASLDVLAPAAVQPSNFIAGGDVYDGVFTTADSFYTRWTDQAGRVTYEQDNGSSSTGRIQSINLSAVVGSAMTLPLTSLRLTFASGGRLLYDRDLQQFGIPYGPAYGCGSATGDAMDIVACSYASGYTVINVVRYAGTVTYQSREYSRSWNGTGYDESTYVFNQTDPSAPFVVLGNDFAFTIRVQDGGAVYAFSGAGALAPLQDQIVEPRTCASTQVTVPPNTYDLFTCTSSLYTFAGMTGSVSGSGLASQSAARLMP